MVIARESVAAVRGDIQALIALHWHEVGQDKARMRLDPDWDAYLALEAAGQLAVFTARAEGHLVGYAVFLIRRHLHYRSIRVAVNDLVFLHPERRRGLAAGARLIATAERMLKADGIQKVYFGVKPWLDFGPLLARFGYEPAERTWAKWIGG